MKAPEVKYTLGELLNAIKATQDDAESCNASALSYCREIHMAAERGDREDAEHQLNWLAMELHHRELAERRLYRAYRAIATLNNFVKPYQD